MLKRLAIFAVIASTISSSYLPQGRVLGQAEQYAPEQSKNYPNERKNVSQPSPIIEDDNSKCCNREANQDAEGGQQTPSRRWNRADRIALFTGISAALQFLALLFTLWLMSRSGKRQLRAYVIPETGTIVNVANPDPMVGPDRDTPAAIKYPESGPIAQVQIKNVGQTPAYDVLHWASLEFHEYPLISKLPSMPEEDEKHRSPLGPGIPITKNLVHKPLTVTEISKLKGGSGCLYWNGIIMYRDIYRKKHFTRYRLMYGKMGGAVGVHTNLTFADEGNYSDDSQPKYQRFKERMKVTLKWMDEKARE